MLMLSYRKSRDYQRKCNQCTCAPSHSLKFTRSIRHSSRRTLCLFKYFLASLGSNRRTWSNVGSHRLDLTAPKALETIFNHWLTWIMSLSSHACIHFQCFFLLDDSARVWFVITFRLKTSSQGVAKSLLMITTLAWEISNQSLR